MANDVPIDALLADLGLSGRTAGDARAVLEAEGLTNPRKQRIATAKAGHVAAAIDRHWQRLCHNCLPRAAVDGRSIVTVSSAKCSMCGGSNNARAVSDMVDACRAAGIERLVVVGGSPNARRDLDETVAGSLDLRLVDGTRSMTRQAAQADIAWADLIVVLGATQLAHKVSKLYTRDPAARKKLVTTSRRGIEAIADDITRSDVVTGARR
jgi:hypothetical protein